MSISKPYKRTARMFTDGSYSKSGKGKYIRHKDYADAPENFIRAFLLIQKDIFDLFDYVEPSDKNKDTYSHRIHELLLRTCVEVEANCKAILRENGYKKSGGNCKNREHWTMNDYKKIEQSHYLSQYKVKVPNWLGNDSIRKPYFEWAKGNSLPWYQTYNSTKHDRHSNFNKANFDNLINAVCGLSALIASQFITDDLSPAGSSLRVNIGGPDDGFEPSIGDFFRLQFPKSIPSSECYDFESEDIDFNKNIFQQFKYS